MVRRFSKVVLAYSGGLDTSVILRWLKETYKCDVVAYCADIGQGDDMDEVRRKGEATGASQVVIEDRREEFVRDFVFPMLRANAIYEQGYLLGTSIARPCIAMGQIQLVRKLGADAVSHGATGKGNDQVRFELTYMALEPNIAIIAPWRDPLWTFTGRPELLAYADTHGIPVTASVEKPYSIDQNLLHISFEGGVLEDPWSEPPADMYHYTVPPLRAPDRPAEMEIDFEKGNPVAVDGRRMTPAELLTYLNDVAGSNGIGRVDMVENRYVGMKSRGVYETPGGTVLQAAHRAVESITLDREVIHLRDSLIPQYSRLIYFGYWFSPERELMQKMIDASQERVTGTVRLRLYKGNCIILGRRSPYSLYRKDMVSFDQAGGYEQGDATGFIRLNALRLRIRAMTGK
ncbi:MAG: argininosuccinate synthase [Deltaproteobacteria bacterium]|nr:argininosuccinate synthase [Deltaproteobacteria bacterium]